MNLAIETTGGRSVSAGKNSIQTIVDHTDKVQGNKLFEGKNLGIFLEVNANLMMPLFSLIHSFVYQSIQLYLLVRLVR